jgi:hypothetical protein
LPIRFHLAENAPLEEKRRVRKELTSKLKVAIATVISKTEKTTTEKAEFPHAGTGEGPGRFRKKSEEVGFYQGFGDDEPKRVYFAHGPVVWLRLMPEKPIKRIWAPHEIQKIAESQGTLPLPIKHTVGLDFVRAEDGWGVFNHPSTGDLNAREIVTSGIVFIFNTGEIWSADTTLLSVSDKHIPLIEEALNQSMKRYVQFMSALEIPHPYKWTAGISGVKGRQLLFPPPPGFSRIHNHRGPLCLSETIEESGSLILDQSPADALRPFYNKLFEKCGEERPEYLDH